MRLVARFNDAKGAIEGANELRAHFTAHAADWASDGGPPEVIAVADSVVIYHPRRGDFGAAALALIEAKEASASPEEDAMPTLTATFRLPMGKPGEQLGKELRAFFDQATTISKLSDFKTAPFGPAIDLAEGLSAQIAYSHEGSLFEMHMPLSVSAIDVVKKFLMSRKVEQLKLRLGVAEDLARLGTGAKTPPIATMPSSMSTMSSSSTVSAGPATVGRKFLFTGKMATLGRDDGKKRVEWLGGIAASSVSQDLDYLVVGDDGSPLYGAGAKGSKILAAEKLIAHGSRLKIISEKQFLDLKRK